MPKIKVMNKISPQGIEILNKAGHQTGAQVDSPDAILVRSTDLHELSFNPELKAIARAGAGVNNIPIKRCTEQGIVVFNTPGGNANAVKEFTVLAMLLASRDVLGGVSWVLELGQDPGLAKAVEAGKSAFAGVELINRTLGVIGLGAVGGQVANIGHALGMNVVGYDPFLSVEAAWRISRAVVRAENFDEVYAKADYLSLHVPSTPDTRGLIGRKAIARMKDGVRIINSARADLVDEEALKEALDAGKVARYVTDFPTPGLNGHHHVLSIPHLGASTEEAEENCAVMAAQQLREFLRTGNITNSVNFPHVSMPMAGAGRICITHSNIPKMLAQFSTLLANQQINIENMLNRSREEIAYTIIEIDRKVTPEMVASLRATQGVIRVNCF